MQKKKLPAKITLPTPKHTNSKIEKTKLLWKEINDFQTLFPNISRKERLSKFECIYHKIDAFSNEHKNLISKRFIDILKRSLDEGDVNAANLVLDDMKWEVHQIFEPR